jgi:hypothetical protein
MCKAHTSIKRQAHHSEVAASQTPSCRKSSSCIINSGLAVHLFAVEPGLRLAPKRHCGHSQRLGPVWEHSMVRLFLCVNNF